MFWRFHFRRFATTVYSSQCVSLVCALVYVPANFGYKPKSKVLPLEEKRLWRPTCWLASSVQPPWAYQTPHWCTWITQLKWFSRLVDPPISELKLMAMGMVFSVELFEIDCFFKNYCESKIKMFAKILWNRKLFQSKLMAQLLRDVFN